MPKYTIQETNRIYKDGIDTGYSIIKDTIEVYRIRFPDGTLSIAYNKDRAVELTYVYLDRLNQRELQASL